MSRGQWAVVHRPGTHEVHVVPENDLVAHDGGDCPCGPSTEPAPRPDGSYGWLVVHHSLDGRERTETP